MDQSKEPQTANANALKTRINPVAVYCIIGAVVAFNVILYLYVMDRLNQLDKQKAELMNSIKQYQEVPIPDLMKESLKDPELLNNQADEQIEKLNQLEKEMDRTSPERKEAADNSKGIPSATKATQSKEVRLQEVPEKAEKARGN